jgi:hypothetical protein
MAKLKTQKNNSSVIDFIKSVEDQTKRQDSLELLKIFEECTNEKPAMWGNSIVGFGSYHYKSERSTQEGDWPLTGFSPRKQNLTIYIMPGFDIYQKELENLGKFKTSVSCLYVKRLSDINIDILKKMIKSSVKEMINKYH